MSEQFLYDLNYLLHSMEFTWRQGNITQIRQNKQTTCIENLILKLNGVFFKIL